MKPGKKESPALRPYRDKTELISRDVNSDLEWGMALTAPTFIPKMFPFCSQKLTEPAAYISSSIIPGAEFLAEATERKKDLFGSSLR